MEPTMAGSAEHDGAVRETASDASLCKLSASQLGYYADPFVQFFVKAPSRRMPIINRGYYARVAAVEALVRQFLGAADAQKQVVILGAGLDTMFFRLKSGGLLANCEYFELDFPDVTMQKVSTIKRRNPLNGLLGLGATQDFMAAVSSGYTELNVPGYHLLPCDLRDLDATTAKMEAAGIDRSIPTLFVSECVLIYMEAKFSTQLVNWSSSYFDDVSFALYEQILPDDAFGKVMMANIKARGCDLQSIRDFPTVEAQIARFTEHHYEVAQCWDMNRIYYHYLDPAERAKRERLEIFDELEEFHLLQAHYCVVVASKKASTPAAHALALGEAKA
ncbi:Leucine carboxyl methyltransferase 1 [Phytophthora pseudosyringae]|uniref:Leucine carboxyl methyltransferase 1 n=1 Tax=Phytophthora pseudosyringae TaxID=221518 RepID=A0A8T1W6M8_9STRA|nr:Leucine carboxyl methyltransferase 1 [Phytophthora pseudosyringae]